MKTSHLFRQCSQIHKLKLPNLRLESRNNLKFDTEESCKKNKSNNININKKNLFQIFGQNKKKRFNETAQFQGGN